MVEIPTLRDNPSPPPDIIMLFEEFERRLWKPEDSKKYSSRFPHFSTAIKQREADSGIDELGMDRVLEPWLDLSVADIKKAAGQAE